MIYPVVEGNTSTKQNTHIPDGVQCGKKQDTARMPGLSVFERRDQGNVRKTLKWNKSEKPTRVLVLTVAMCALDTQEKMMCEMALHMILFFFHHIF